MTFCSSCGEELNDGVKFCSACGAPVESSSEEPGDAIQVDKVIGKAAGTFLSGLKSVGDIAMQTMAEKAPKESKSERGKRKKHLRPEHVARGQQDLRVTYENNDEPALLEAGVERQGVFAAGAYENRQQVYAGVILKCPSCGEVIDNTVAICPICGHHLTGKGTTSAVVAFRKELNDLDKEPEDIKGVFVKILNDASGDATDRRIELVKTFPVPNSVEEILEFMLLAVSNIDIKLSKKSILNSGALGGGTLAHELSDAWVSKMEQCYTRARITFPNDPMFAEIQNIYFKKMEELKRPIV